MTPGRYRAHAIDFDLAVNENTCNVCAVILFEINDGQQFAGDTIAAYLYLTDAAAPNTLRTLRQMGWSGKNVGEIRLSDLNVPVDIVVEEDAYNGRSMLRVKWINPIRKKLYVQGSISKEQRKALSERYKSLAEQTMLSRSAGKYRSAMHKKEPVCDDPASMSTPDGHDSQDDCDNTLDDNLPF